MGTIRKSWQYQENLDPLRGLLWIIYCILILDTLNPDFHKENFYIEFRTYENISWFLLAFDFYNVNMIFTT